MNCMKKVFLCRSWHNRTYAKYKNPIQRTLDYLRGDVRHGVMNKDSSIPYPEHADIVIVGGGFLGSSAAYWIKTKAGEGLNVVVIDKNITNNFNGTYTPLGFLSQHYSLPENIMLSQSSSDFLRNIKNNLNKHIDIKYQPHAYLTLASENYCEKLEKNVSVLMEYGIKHELISVEQIKKRYPWINLSNVKLGCLSIEGEGTFDSGALLKGTIEKCKELGTKYVDGEVVGFAIENQRDVLVEGIEPMMLHKINAIKYKTKDNEERSIKFAICVLAAGTESHKIAKLANIGTGDGLLSLPLPIERSEYNFYAIGENTEQSILKLNSPMVMDSSGLWLKRNGLNNNLLCGQITLQSDKNLTKEEKFRNLFKPSLNERFPQFSEIEIKELKPEVYDCNTYDDSGILGPHPYHMNLIIAAGFGRLGVQHSPAIGKAISELIIDGNYISTNLTRFGFDRILINEPIAEFNVY